MCGAFSHLHSIQGLALELGRGHTPAVGALAIAMQGLTILVDDAFGRVRQQAIVRPEAKNGPKMDQKWMKSKQFQPRARHPDRSNTCGFLSRSSRKSSAEVHGSGATCRAFR